MSVLAQPPAPTQAPVPTWPRILATVEPGGACTLLLGGATAPVRAGSAAEARAALLALVREHAQALGRTVRMDTTGPEGAGQVLVTPAGQVIDAGDSAPPTHDLPSEVEQALPSEANRHLPSEHDAEHQRPHDPPPAQSHHEAPSRSQAQPLAATSPWPPVRGGERSGPTWSAPAPDLSAPRPSAGFDDPDPEPSAPTLADLLGARAATRPVPAQQGWRAGLRTLTGGALRPAPGRAELAQRDAVATIARPFDGPKTVVVVNPKGGAHKTTAALLIAATLGRERGGSTLAWDNNETRGTMGWRATPAPHTRTAIDLLGDLERFNAAGARVSDLDAYVRAQQWGHFDVLASDEDAASADLVDAEAFEALHATLARFYRVMVIDTGNNMRAPNWAAAIAAADQLVIVSTIREDTSQSAAWLADALAATGHTDLVAGAVTVLTAPARSSDPALATRLHQHFAALTRTVIDVPHDRALIAGGPIDYPALSPASRNAWLEVTAAVADGL